MKIFGKTVSKKDKRTLILHAILLVLIGALLLFSTFYSFAWFTRSSRVSTTNMQVTVSTEKYDILIERTTEYNTGYNFVAGTGELKDKLSEAGYDLSQTTTSASSKLALEIANEYVTETKRYLMPGAYGTVTFYLKPKSNGNFMANFSLNIGAYAIVYEDDTPVMQSLDPSSPILDILKGHLLFFTGRTGASYANYKYTGLIDGSFSYDTSEHSKCEDVGKTDCYKIVLYWEWPITYYEISQNVSTTSPEVINKYPAEVWTYLTEHGNYFFASATTSNKQEAYSDAYNDGDQMIGVGTNCIVLYIEAN